MQALADGCARFGAILDAAEECLGRDDLHAAAGLAQLAASCAFPANAGLFASPRLERLLCRLGERLPGEAKPAVIERAGRQRHVLHVLSHAKPIGGDSRFAWRWIEQDAGTRSSVAITRQGDVSHAYGVPAELTDAVHASGGAVHALQAPRDTPMEAARELRRLCREADTVVLHLYPYDVIPVIALAAHCDGTPTLFVNHSDHTFWIGASVAHAIAHLRPQAPAFLQLRRALAPGCACMLPIPLGHASPLATREQARHALGIPADAVLLLTIASPFKYSSPGETGLLDLVLPVLLKQPQARLFAVGPEPSGAWRHATRATGGRVRAFGRRWDNALLYASADAYLDSVPFSSITSLLEAGLHGVPLLGRRPRDAALALMGPSAPGLGTMMLASDDDAYREQLERLITEPALRRDAGRAVRDDILREHGEQSWLRQLDRVYATLASRGGQRGCLAEATDRFEADGLSMAVVRLFRQVQGPRRIRQLMSQHLGPLPYRTRFALTLRLGRHGMPRFGLNLLPPPAHGIARRLGRGMRALLTQFGAAWKSVRALPPFKR